MRAKVVVQATSQPTLPHQEERYRKIIEYSNDAIFLVDPHHDQILEANPVACRMLGYTQDELLALPISAIHPNEMPQMVRFTQDVLAQGNGWTNELSCRTKSGVLLPAEISASIVELDGRSCLLALIRDTTERKRTEARIRQEVAKSEALARVAAKLNAQLEIGTILHAVCEETTKALNVPASVLLFFDERQKVFYPAATYGLPPEFKQKYIPNPRSVYDQYPQHTAQIVVPNLRALPNLVNASLFEEYGIHAIAIASLNRDDNLLGALSAYALDPTHVFSEDDINLLRSLADLAAQAVRNATLYATEQRRSQQFRAIEEVGRRLTAILSYEDLVTEIAHLAHHILQQTQVAVGLLENEEIVYRIYTEQDKRQDSTQQKRRLEYRSGQLDGIAGWVIRNAQAVLVSDVTNDPRHTPVSASHPTGSELVAPIKLQDSVAGVIHIASEQMNAFDEMDLNIVQLLADQSAVAIQNARLHEQARQLAIFEERQRLARELHDSVTQALYGMTLFTAATNDLLAIGDVKTAMNHIQVMQETAQLALREMRLLIFQLRSPSLKDGLAAALQERLESVEQRSGVKTELRVTGIGCADSRTDEELYRIAQESLNNALKHAHAHHIRIHLLQGQQNVRMEICDDGRGFSPDAALRSGGLGLRGMKERVAQLGGTLSIHSRHGEGTTICVEVKLS